MCLGTAAGAVACGRSGEGRWLSHLEIAPHIIRISEHESARVSFIVRDRRYAAAGFARVAVPGLRSIQVFAVAGEGRGDSARRYFMWREATPGYKVAIWDGTLVRRDRPPLTGAYRVSISVTDERGRREEVSRHVWLLNWGRRPVLPRTQSGLALRSLEFDGTHAILTDGAGNAIRVRAISGLKPNNPYNPRHVDYTRPQYQLISERGPIPAGDYSIGKNDVQQPDVRDDELVFPTWATVREWGPMRVMLNPRKDWARARNGFFFHLDTDDDGTAGCIGVSPGDEGKFNQMMSLIAWMPNDSLPVTVRYRLTR